jgi:dTMP kinase
MFIVFEWVDWSWKDTQLNRVFEYLRDRNKNSQIWVTKEPTWNTIAWKEILKRLSGEWFKDWKEALDLYVKDREEQTNIRKEILKHSIILSSRFDYSTFAYQWVQGLSFDEIYNAHNYDNILLPDITFIFDVSIENIEKRLNNRWWDKEFFEDLNFLEKVKIKYLESAKKLKNNRKIYIIDANKTIEEVFEEIKLILSSSWL